MASAFAVILCVLILAVSKSYEECAQSRFYTKFCDSVEDLYQPNNFGAEIYINLNQIPFTNLNHLHKVPEHVNHIQELKINRAINYITEDAFVNFRSIYKIELKHNVVDVLLAGTFRNLPKLRDLLIFNCSLKSISPGVFFNLTNLKMVEVIQNNLTVVNVGIFNNLTLERLVLSENQISKIDNLAFNNLPNMKILDLGHNRISSFNVMDHLNHPNKLLTLGLSRNRLEEVTRYMLEGLENLRILDLSFNLITYIEPLAFGETPNLVRLYLHGNLLKVLSGGHLPARGLNNLRSVYLSYNKLTYLSSDFFFRLSSLEKIAIAGNPWQCFCLDSVLKWLNRKNVSLSRCDRIYFNGVRPVCVMPEGERQCEYLYDDSYHSRYQAVHKLYPEIAYCI